MAVSLYDTALLNKFKYWCNNTNITIVGPDETERLFESIADRTNDNPLKLPLVSLTRSAGFTIENPTKRMMTFDGITLDANEQNSIQLNAIPISIPYKLDIYTRYLSEADELCRNFIFNFVNYPKFEVIIPYNDVNLAHESSIWLNTDIADESSKSPRVVPGQFTRLSIGFTVKDAYLWDIKIRPNVTIDYIVEEK